MSINQLTRHSFQLAFQSRGMTVQDARNHKGYFSIKSFNHLSQHILEIIPPSPAALQTLEIPDILVTTVEIYSDHSFCE